MKRTREFEALISRWLRYSGLLGVLYLSVPVAVAQSSVAVKVENTRGAAVNDVKVMARRLEKNQEAADSGGGQVRNLAKADDRKYTIDGLSKGKYRFYACDEDLTYEPDYKDISLGENESRKFTLVLQEQPASQPVSDVKAGEKVCLIHDETGCRTLKAVAPDGAVKYAGVQNHYHVEDADACKTN